MPDPTLDYLLAFLIVVFICGLAEIPGAMFGAFCAKLGRRYTNRNGHAS